MTDESPWPTRHVAEYAYCPRLFYFMEVEGVFIPSSDTEKGQSVHRRTGKPSAAPQPPPESAQEGSGDATEETEDPDRPRAIRSLSLTSKELGLTATLDLAEIDGDVAVPVEYRKGRPKHIEIEETSGNGERSDAADPDRPGVEPWPTDRVQVGLQALLLEKTGYDVPEAVFYYAAEKLRLRTPGRPAFALDLMEPFRPVIADSVTVTAFNRGGAHRRSLHAHGLGLRAHRRRAPSLL